MKNEEKYMNEELLRENPFRVPEGYFDNLTDRVMSQLPERRQKSRLLPLRPWYYAAASIAFVAIMGFTYHFHQNTADEQSAIASVETNTENSYIDEVADYVMFDNTEIYACLTDN